MMLNDGVVWAGISSDVAGAGPRPRGKVSCASIRVSAKLKHSCPG